MELLFGVVVLVVVIVIVFLVKSAIVVPQGNEYIVERLGKYRCTLLEGFHILSPNVDNVAYKRSMKEEFVDFFDQPCITADALRLHIDSIISIQVVNARQSAYEIEDYHSAVARLAQTSLYSAVGKISLDNIFESIEDLNRQVLEVLNGAIQNWGIKVLRYEIKDIRIADKKPAEI